MNRIEELEAILKARTEELNSTTKAFADYVRQVEAEKTQVKKLNIDDVSNCLHPANEQEIIIRCKKCKRIISNGDIFF